ncbi:TPA: cytochrome c biogenesis protein DipZ [Klebsiella aerogenes]|nr:cytochrome c biogenesis protein DipZ [Klebsiella aerogenes]
MAVVIAFLAGMLTLLSPCTLPVIPLVFASVSGRKGQLILLLFGMGLMFTAVSLLATAAAGWLVNLTIVGRWLALGFLVVVAISLLSSRVAGWLGSPAVALGNQLNQQSYRYGSGLASVFAGLAIGLLWAPCAGPVLGAIFSLALLQGNSVTTGILLLSYASGCALMLLLLGWFGARLISRLRGGQVISGRLRQLAGVAMLAAVALIASGSDRYLQGASGLTHRLEQRLSAFMPQDQQRVRLEPIVAPRPTSAMPELQGGTAWINSPPLTNAALKGKVVLIDFWTRDCINCQHTLPYVRAWANKYRDAGLVVIGVHTPEYPWERSLPQLREAVSQRQLNYPVVSDNNYAIWNAFGNQYWPAHYIFDARGQLRYTAFGEGDYARQEQVIQQLLREART